MADQLLTSPSVSVKEIAIQMRNASLDLCGELLVCYKDSSALLLCLVNTDLLSLAYSQYRSGNEPIPGLCIILVRPPTDTNVSPIRIEK
eukprot:scaffold19600_cov78-Skeletonema_dohrnii-CCMP3373.AAC.1